MSNPEDFEGGKDFSRDEIDEAAARKRHQARLVAESHCGAVFGTGVETAVARGKVVAGLCTVCIADGNDYCRDQVLSGSAHLIERVMAVASTMYRPFTGGMVKSFIDLERLTLEVRRMKRAVRKAKRWITRTCNRNRIVVRKAIERFCDDVSDSTVLRAIDDNRHLLLDHATVKREYIAAIAAIYQVFADLSNLIATLQPSTVEPNFAKLRTVVYIKKGGGGFRKK